MKHTKPGSRTPQYDYGLALKNALSWLGDRYLLAEPVTRRIDERKPFFVEARSWHEPRRVAQGFTSIQRHTPCR